jgi:hypothetical protein
LQVALAHTDAATARDYIRIREVPVSKVRFETPAEEISAFSLIFGSTLPPRVGVSH